MVAPARLPAPGEFSDDSGAWAAQSKGPPTPSSAADDEARWEWPSASVQWGRRLGNGSFGSVLAVESAGLRLAAKRMQYDECERDATVRMLRREALAMRKLTHPNVRPSPTGPEPTRAPLHLTETPRVPRYISPQLLRALLHGPHMVFGSLHGGRSSKLLV